jgi:hypothetical protein
MKSEGVIAATSLSISASSADWRSFSVFIATLLHRLDILFKREYLSATFNAQLLVGDVILAVLVDSCNML